MGARFQTTFKPKKGQSFEFHQFLLTNGVASSAIHFQTNDKIFSQGDLCDALFYIQKGRVKLSVISRQGKEAIIAILGPGDFVGEACLRGQRVHLASATALVPSSVLKIDKSEMQRALQRERELPGYFILYLLARNARIEEDLIDQLFNSSEKRLARTLLLLAHYGNDDKAETAIPNINQETLAKMIGISRERVNFFMSKFKKLGFIAYDRGLQIHKSLLNVILHD
jgi:CRP/FNR family cyclic AMP-dependent transcriptional regulator